VPTYNLITFQVILQDQRYGTSALCGVSVYIPAFAKLVLPSPTLKDDQIELTWVAGYISRCFTCL